jgi:hypothetical protein
MTIPPTGIPVNTTPTAQASTPTKSDLYVQQLAATNPSLFNLAFGQSSLSNDTLSSSAGILKNPAYGGYTDAQTNSILGQAEGLFQMGLSTSPIAQQLNQSAQMGMLQQQQAAQQQLLLQQQQQQLPPQQGLLNGFDPSQSPILAGQNSNPLAGLMQILQGLLSALQGTQNLS